MNMDTHTDDKHIAFGGKITLFGVIMIAAIVVGSAGASTTGQENTSLKITNLQDVLMALKKVDFGNYKWHNLGLALGLFKNRLKNIEVDNQDVDNRLTECLSQWLGRVDKVDKKGGTTWAALSRALREIDDIPTAEHIEKNYVTDAHTKGHTVDNSMLNDAMMNPLSILIALCLVLGSTAILCLFHWKCPSAKKVHQERRKPVNPVNGIDETDTGNRSSLHSPQSKDIKNSVPFEESAMKDVKVLLLVAKDPEFQAVYNLTTPMEGYEHVFETRTTEGMTIFGGVYGQDMVAIWQIPQQGQDQIIELLPKLLKDVKAQFIICIGFCYGMYKDKQKLEDIIVADEILDCTARIEKETTQYIVRRKAVGKTLLGVFRKYGGDETVKVGNIASSPTLMDSDHKKSELLQYAPKAIAGEMEGAAIMLAKVHGVPEPEVIVIKAIADWGDGNKEDTRDIQEQASDKAARYVHSRMSKSSLINAPAKP